MMSVSRLFLLIEKELLQMRRDRSVFVITFALPLLLLIIFGYGIRFDIDNIPAAVVLEERTPLALSLVRELEGSHRFTVTEYLSRAEAEAAFTERKAELIFEIPRGFSEKLPVGTAEIGLTVYGVDSQSAQSMKSQAQGVILQWVRARLSERGLSATTASDGTPAVSLILRNRFNDENNSTRYLVPGLLILALSIGGSFICSLLVAREWERGTMPSLLTTPATPAELFLSKWLPYSLLTVVSFTAAWLASALLFGTRIEGSAGWLFLTAAVYGAWSSSLGLCLSARLKNQFIANEYAVVMSFLPTMMLSGFIFDLRCIPPAISVFGSLLPPAFAIESLKICFLSGGNEDILLRNVLILLLWCVPTVGLALAALKKRPKGKGGKV